MAPTKPRPTAAELEILGVLWSAGPSTVRDVQEALGLAKRGPRPGYTTVLKLMQIMAQKGLLLRDESRRSHVYRTADSSGTTRGRMVGDLIDRAFAGSTAQLVLSALSSRHASRQELAEIREILERHDPNRGGDDR